MIAFEIPQPHPSIASVFLVKAWTSWAIENVSEENNYWWFDSEPYRRRICFGRHEDALAFRLKFGI